MFIDKKTTFTNQKNISMKKSILLISLSICFNSLFGQYDLGGNGSSTDVARNLHRESRLNNYTQDNVSKSKLNYFLDDDWIGGVMFTNDSASINGYTYRYNIYTDQIELRSLVDPFSIEVLSIGTKKFIYSEFYLVDGSMDEGYFELIENGDCKVLLRRSVKYSQMTKDIEGYGSEESTSIEENLFIKKGNDPAKKIEKTKEFLADIFSDKEKAVDYMNNKTILFMTEKKVIELINYYNKI